VCIRRHHSCPTCTIFSPYYFADTRDLRALHSFPTRRSSDLSPVTHFLAGWLLANTASFSRRERALVVCAGIAPDLDGLGNAGARSEEHTSELQSQSKLVCRLLLEKKKDAAKFEDRQLHRIRL